MLAKKNGIDIKQTKFQEYFEALQALKSREKEEVHDSKLNHFIGKAKIVATNREYLKRLCFMIPPFFAVGVA